MRYFLLSVWDIIYKLLNIPFFFIKLNTRVKVDGNLIYHFRNDDELNKLKKIVYFLNCLNIFGLWALFIFLIFF